MPITLGTVAPHAISLLGGLFGGKPKMPKAQKELLEFQRNIAQQLARFGNSVPGSDPGESAAMAQLHGLLGEQQRGQRDQLLASAGTPSAGLPANAIQDMLLNLGNAQVAQQSSADSQMMSNFLGQRRQALVQASGVGGAAGQFLPPPTQGVDLAGTFGSFAEEYGRSQEERKRRREFEALAALFKQGQGQGQGGGGYMTPLKSSTVYSGTQPRGLFGGG